MSLPQNRDPAFVRGAIFNLGREFSACETFLARFFVVSVNDGRMLMIKAEDRDWDLGVWV